MKSPLSVQEGFDISFLKYYFLPLLNTIGYQLKILFEKLSFWNWWWCGPFALGSYFLPLWHESPKTESLEPIEVLSSPLVLSKWVKIIPKMKSFCSPPQRWGVAWSDGEGWVTEWKPLSLPKTPIPFQYTYDLVWNRLENTLVIAYKEIWAKVYKCAMCAI